MLQFLYSNKQMKSISSLQESPSWPKNNKKSLPTIENTTTTSFSLKPDVKCAFHVTERITNFCKDPQCYLPLCPKCIKIHSKQHSEMGTFGSFQPIQQCMKEAHEYFVDIFETVSYLQRISYDVEQAYKMKKEEIFVDFERLKDKAFEEMHRIFYDYGQALKEQISKEDRIFTEQLISYHDRLHLALEETRNSCRKFNNRHLTMQGLITFYSQDHNRSQLKQSEQLLKDMAVTKITIKSNDEELKNLEKVIQRFLRMGDQKNTFDEMVNERYQGMYNFQNFDDHVGDFSYPSARTDVNLKNYRINEEKNVNSEIFESPLNTFSLQKSRNLRKSIKEQQRYEL